MTNNDVNPSPVESPPTYEYAVTGTGSSTTSTTPVVPLPQHQSPGQDGKAAPMDPSQPVTMYGATAPMTTGPTQVFHYQHPITGEHVASLLPPHHPQMVCLQEGAHLPQSRFGLLGVLAAVVWFPLGIGLCLLDRKVRCKRCGESIDEGLCG